MTPTKEWIEETKKKVGKLFAVNNGGDSFYFRAIKRGEHLAIQKEAFPEGVPLDPERVSADDNARLENLIVKTCVLWPETVEPEELAAGVPPLLVAQIMRISGFGLVSEPEEV